MISRYSDWKDSRNGRGGTYYTLWSEDPAREDASAAAIQTVSSADGSLYQRWQADVLAYSHRKVHQPGPLTRLLSSYEEASPFSGRPFQISPYSPHPLSGDDCAAYNKPAALKAWLQDDPAAEDIVLILDPDCVFLEPLTGSVSRGHLMAQSWHLMYPAHHRWFVEKHCQYPELVDDVGIPILIHKDDLVALAPLWLKKTEEIRNDPVRRNHVGWIAEMWAYALAAAELGLRHTTCELACVNKEGLADRPVVHYCYASSDATNDRWVWHKRIYRPWERVPDPPDGVPLATKALIALLNEWVAITGHQMCLHEA